ncbi:cob(I)yrinic acid a,c-diamide adenosyltransferase [bacterium]|nr:MAG: cob(I)yrinic acid a,c-diamide adenosyltransferase [bacterium]
MLQIYTGDGKGKTTAALGLALRACGHGRKVIMIQFMKGDIEYGEVKIASKIPGFELHQFGLPTFVEKGNPAAEDLRLAKEGFDFACEIISKGEYDVVILDELNCAIDYGLIYLEDVLELLDRVPKEMEIIITGRNARPKLTERADLVSEIKEIKHPFQKGILAREGIDY